MNENAITKLTVTPLKESNNGVVAVATATFYNAITINSITVNQGENGLYVRMPQKKTKQGQYIDVAHPLSSELRQEINNQILNAYQSKEYKQQNSYSNQINIEAQKCVKYEAGKYGNMLARMDIVFGDMVIHNAKLINNTDNKPFIALPSYKKNDREYVSLCVPANKEIAKILNEASLNEYNTVYEYSKMSDKQIEAVRNAGVHISVKNIDTDKIAQYRVDDAIKIRAILSRLIAQGNSLT